MTEFQFQMGELRFRSGSDSLLLAYWAIIGKIKIAFSGVKRKCREKCRNRCQIFLASDYFGVVSHTSFRLPHDSASVPFGVVFGTVTGWPILL